ncbi:MAG: IPTL-CTERM sorting domain-containing protein [Bacteroidales bacterium]|nr:IPTL-CTERM sorting domain-containing protein [Bacteroidales bacterium]
MRKLFTLILSLTVVFAFSQQRMENNKPFPAQVNKATITVTGLGEPGIDPNALVASLVGPGITFSNVTFTGVQGGTGTASAGGFTGGMAIFGIDQGVVLSSGRAVNSLGPNNSGGTGTSNGLPGDPDLEAVFGCCTYDACVLEFDFIPTASTMYVQYVLASEEYNEYINYADCFAFFLDGQNIALIPGSGPPPIPVSVGTINLGSYPALYVNNSPGPYDIEADGFTKVLTATGTVVPGQTHHIKLALADKGDGVYDTWVFLKGASFSVVNPDIPTLSQWGLIILGCVLLGFGTFYILRMRG